MREERSEEFETFSYYFSYFFFSFENCIFDIFSYLAFHGSSNVEMFLDWISILPQNIFLF